MLKPGKNRPSLYWPFPSASAHGLNVWNHRGPIGHSGNDTSLFPYKWKIKQGYPTCWLCQYSQFIRVISNHCDSSHVGRRHSTVCWVDFADSISASHFDFTDYIPPLLTEFGVYIAVKYFGTNKYLCQLWIITGLGSHLSDKTEIP